MDLTNCPSCSVRVVRKANGECPSCGHRAEAPKRIPTPIAPSTSHFDETGHTFKEADKKQTAATGKWLTLGCFGVLILVPVVGEIFFVVKQGELDPVGAPAWFLMNLCLGFIAWRGKQWPRIAVAVFHLIFFGPLLIVTLYAFFMMTRTAEPDFPRIIAMFVSFLIPVAASLTLLFARPIRVFIDRQK